MHFSKGSVSVWLKTPSLVRKRASLPSMSRLANMSSERWKEWKQVCLETQSHPFGDGWNECHEGPYCTLDLFRSWGRNGMEPMIWLSEFLKEFDKGSKERTAIELKTLVRGL